MKRRLRKNTRLVGHYPSLRNKFGINSNVYMFTQDASRSIMPVHGNTKFSSFNADIEANKDDYIKAKALCSSLAKFDRYGTSALISDAIEQVANRLVWWGRAVYEITHAEDHSSQLLLHSAYDHRLYSIAGYYIQWIPIADYQYFKKLFAVLPSKDAWAISIPKILGGIKKYKKMLTKLKTFDSISPRFVREDLASRTQTIGFDLKKYVDEAEAYYTGITRKWGWNRRDYSQRNNTEFFTFYQIITFRWAQAILREHIINELNKLFLKLGLDAKIVVSGLPTSQQILNVRNELVSGKIQFKEAIDQVSI